MRTGLKLSGVVVALVVLGMVMAYLAGVFESKIPVDVSRTVSPGENGNTFTVEAVTEPLVEQVAGTFRAKVETVISPLITATITSIAVWPGDEVQQGDLLVELDSRELRARADQAHQADIAAKAALLQTEQDFQRVKRILDADPGAISRAEIDRARAALETAQAELARAQRQEDEAQAGLSHSTIKAPISGRIVERHGDPGDTGKQGVPLLRMYHPGGIRLEAFVRESVASRLKKGQNLLVSADSLRQELEAVVDEIVPSADPGSRSFLVKANIPAHPGLYPGMFGRLFIPVGETERIYVPAGAITRIGQLDYVIVATDQGPARRYVRLGLHSRDGYVEVISGLAAGERIVLTGATGDRW